MIVSGVPGNVDEVWPGHYCKGTSKYYVITFRDILPPHPGPQYRSDKSRKPRILIKIIKTLLFVNYSIS